MSIVHSVDGQGPDALACAQAGCASCLNDLIRQHEGLVHSVLKGIYRYGVPYADLVQEGRIALWQAVQGYDPDRGCAFSTYATVAIQRRLYTYIRRMTRPQGHLPATLAPDPGQQVVAGIWQAQLRQAVDGTLPYLLPRLRQIMVAAYGLDGAPPRSLAAIGRHLGLSRERVRQLRNDGLLLLRVPAVALALHQLSNQSTRADYARLQTLNRAWLRQRRGRGTALRRAQDVALAA